MTTSPRQRPTAKRLLDGILQALHDAQEPLDDDLVLVPVHFDVYVHPDAYLDLEPLFPRVEAHARQKLDAELDRLNRRRERSPLGWLQRAFDAVVRLLVAERYAQRRAQGRVYERSGERWHLTFSITAEPTAEIDYLAVETDFGTSARASYRGRPTVNIRKRTTLLPNGRFETVLTAQRPTVPVRSGGDTQARHEAVARLHYEDNRGSHVYYMKKHEIVVGRRDESGRPLDIALDTLPDVSREHLRVRYDPAEHVFAVRDVSQYGVMVNGQPIPVSEGAGSDDDAWHPLPPRAQISLAGALFIHFEALPG